MDTEGKRVTYDVYGKQGLDAGLDVAVYEGGMSREQQVRTRLGDRGSWL